MRGKFYFLFLTLMVIFISAFHPVSKADAILAPDYDFSSAVVRADLIVQGRVIETWSEWVEGPFGRNIFTYVLIRVDLAIKGDPNSEEFEFRVMGGTIGDITQIVSDFATFMPEEEVIVLLSSQQGGLGVLDILPGYGKIPIQEGNVSWAGSFIALNKFVEALDAFIKDPDSDLKQLLGSDQIQRKTPDRYDTEEMDVGLREPSLKVGKAFIQGGTELMDMGTGELSLEIAETNHMSYEEAIGQEHLSLDQTERPDLRPYKRSSWDDTIVISNVTGTNTSSSTIYDDETIYVDFGCGNYGSGDAGHFRYGLYIDGTRVGYVDQSSMQAGHATYVLDADVGVLSAGTHTFKVVCDYNHEVSESNEGNNQYSRTFTITASSQLPDLRPYKRSSWDDTIVISNVTGTNTSSSTIYDDETIYVDFGCGNYGSGDAGHFRYGLYIDGTRVGYVDQSSMQAGHATYVLDEDVGVLSAGTHTFKVVCDYNHEVSESNEGNNEYSRTFTITARPQDGPEIFSISPVKGSAGTGTKVTITGDGFGATTGNNGKVEFWYGRGASGDPNRIEAVIVSWSDTRVVCEVPVARLNNYSASAGSGPLRVTTDAGGLSNEVTFIVTFSYSGTMWDNQLGDPEVPYRINENTSDCTGEGAAVQAGAETWNNAGAAFSFTHAGTHSNTDVGRNYNNDIMWSNSLPTGVLAIASRWISGSLILETDIAYNDNDYLWSSDNNPGSNEFDIQSIIVHELGHWLSLRDLYGDIGDGVNDVAKVMYGRGSIGEMKRNLHSDDIAGIRWIYGASYSPAMPWIPLLLFEN